jgi:diguanylate cyclase (GGDEF)-like protein
LPHIAPAPSWSAFSEALLRAPDLACALAIARREAQVAFGCSGLWLAWRGAETGGSDWQWMPDSPPAAVVDALAAQRSPPASAAAGLRIEALGSGAEGPWLIADLAHAPDGDAWGAWCARFGWRAVALIEGLDLRHALDRARRSDRLQRALYAIADLASGEPDMNRMLGELHTIVSGLMYARNFMIVLCDAEIEQLRFLYFADELDDVPPDLDRPVAAAEIPNSLTLAMLRSAQPQMGPSEELRQALGVARDCSLGPDSVDWLGVPMVSGGRVRGGVVVQSYRPEVRYSVADQSLLNFVAQHILTALERKRAREELEERVEERTAELAAANRALRREVAERERSEKLQAALFRIAELAGSTASLEDFYRAVHGVVGELLNARNFYIALLSEDGTRLSFPYSVDEFDPVRQTRALAKGLTEHVLRRGQPLLADRQRIEQLACEGEVASFGTRSRSWLGVPLICDERTVGVLAVQSYSDDIGYDEGDQELLTFVAFHIATGLERKRSQDDLRRAYAELELRVAARTRELDEAVTGLRQQMHERERMQARLEHEALHDALTRLPNRSFLLARLERALERCRHEPRRRFAVLFLDLDRFKIINDSVGHLLGDELLKAVAQRLLSCVRAPDMMARLGGDEFAVLIEDLADDATAVTVARRILDALAEPVRIAGKELYTSASIGIALAHPRYQRPEELLRDADVAMYRAKAAGRQRFELFDEDLHAAAVRLLDLEGDIRRALVRDEFEPWFQPIVSLADGKIVGYEALLRWRHAERGVLVPGDFLSIAEESGSVEHIDWRMFELTCRRVPALTQEGRYVALNVSPRHFRAPELDRRLLAMLARHHIEPEQIRLEVTEGTLLDNADEVRRIIERLRESGVRVQLDDFGTGYSALSYLHRFPLHALKIDRSFVTDLAHNPDGGSAAVVRAILALANSLGLEVIAEGIEFDGQRELLMGLGCQFGQGYLFGEPVAAIP